MAGGGASGTFSIEFLDEKKKTRVRYRVDGKMYEKICPPHHLHPAIISRIKIMACLDISERRLPQDGGINVVLEGRPIDGWRIPTMAWRNRARRAVARISSTNRNIPVKPR